MAESRLHAGDIGGPEIVPRLSSIAPVTAVGGNVDTDDWARDYPAEARVALAGHTILLLHDLSNLKADPSAKGAGIVVSGHSHKPRVETVAGILYLNPSSAGRRRFRLPVTLATLDLSGNAPRATIQRLLE